MEIHKKLGEKLTSIAADRVEEAHKLAQEEPELDE